jgi:hypothetical protein
VRPEPAAIAASGPPWAQCPGRLEDSLWLGKGRLAESNAAQVQAARQIVEGLGREIATPDEARDILQLKGRHDVRF